MLSILKLQFLLLATTVVSISCLNINVDKLLFETNEPYLSFTIDAASLYQDTEGGRLNFSNAELIDAASQFCSSSPSNSVVRIGGTAADDLAFVFGNEDASSYPQSVHIDEAYWNTIISFTELTGCLLVWDLCAYSMRNPDDSWDHTNAEVLFSHMQQHSQSIYGFQLGNEPGIYLKKQGYMPAATQIGEDLHTLRTLLQTYFPANEVLMFGPDVCGPGVVNSTDSCAHADYVFDLLTSAQDTLDGITIHNYGLTSATSADNQCTVTDFTNASVIFQTEPNMAKFQVIHSSVYSDMLGVDAPAMILGETASSGKGGCPDLSNTYIAGYAGWSGNEVTGVDANGSSSTSPPHLQPNPDFFTSVLWNQLMSSSVLEVVYGSNSSLYDGVSYHAHCSRTSTGGVTLAYANVLHSDVDLGGYLSTFSEPIATTPRVEYILTNGESTLVQEQGWDEALKSPYIRLNDELRVLQVGDSMDGKAVTSTSLVLPALSYGFVVFPNASAAACSK